MRAKSRAMAALCASSGAVLSRRSGATDSSAASDTHGDTDVPIRWTDVLPTRQRPQATTWEVIDDDAAEELQAIARRCRKKVRRRALVAAGVAVVPLPGVDWLTDVGVLVSLLPEINREFGLTPEQIANLAPNRRLVVYKAISAGGGLVIGRVVTRDVVLQLLRVVGVRLTTQQAAKFVPIAGQAVSAALTFMALRYVCDQHIQQCLAVARQLPRLAVHDVQDAQPA